VLGLRVSVRLRNETNLTPSTHPNPNPNLLYFSFNPLQNGSQYEPGPQVNTISPNEDQIERIMALTPIAIQTIKEFVNIDNNSNSNSNDHSNVGNENDSKYSSTSNNSLEEEKIDSVRYGTIPIRYGVMMEDQSFSDRGNIWVRVRV
jgi:hypothetical protein